MKTLNNLWTYVFTVTHPAAVNEAGLFGSLDQKTMVSSSVHNYEKMVPMSREFLKTIPTNECTCDECVGICAHGRPCWGLPEEIDRILTESPEMAMMFMVDWYDDTLVLTPALEGFGGLQAPMFPRGRCRMLNHRNRCRIHDRKPIEGRIASHMDDDDLYRGVHMAIVEAWKGKDAEAVFDKWYELLRAKGL